MKKGQLYIIRPDINQARALITKVGPSMVELRWLVGADGKPHDMDKKPLCYPREEIEREINDGHVTIADPEGDPNLMFMMRKSDVPTNSRI